MGKAKCPFDPCATKAENAKVKQAYESAATSNVTLIQKVALLEAEVLHYEVDIIPVLHAQIDALRKHLAEKDAENASLKAEVERSRSKEREWRDKALGLHDHRSWLDSGDIPDESEMIPMHKLTLKNLNDALAEKDREIAHLKKDRDVVRLAAIRTEDAHKERVEGLEGKLKARYIGKCVAPDCDDDMVGFTKYCPKHDIRTLEVIQAALSDTERGKTE